MSSSSDRLTWLHVSDFHFKSDGSNDRDVVLNALLNSASALIERFYPPDALFISGDIAHSGKKAEYVRAEAFINELSSKINIDKSRIFIVPGNHDVDRSEGNGLVRTLSSREESDRYFNGQQNLVHIRERQGNFRDWYNQFYSGIRTFSEKSSCISLEKLNINGIKANVLLVNSAIFCIDNDDSKKLWIGRSSFAGPAKILREDESDLKIIMMHHPIEWLHQIELPNIKSEIQSAADCLMTGHLHDSEIENRFSYSGSFLQTSAGAAYQTREWPNTAVFGSFDGTDITIMPIRFEDSPRPVWTVDTRLFPENERYTSVFRIHNQKEERSSLAQKPSHLEITAPETKSVNSAQPARAEFESDLFLTTRGAPLYAEPRLKSRPQEMSALEDDIAELTVSDIVNSTKSFIIETRPEHGGTNLCKRIENEIRANGISLVHRRDARKLPNYKKKIESEFPQEAAGTIRDSVLVIDNLDFERDERLIKELHKTNWFSRIIGVTTNRDIKSTRSIEWYAGSFDFDYVYLWGMSRGDVRSFAETLFETDQGDLISRIVTKTYSDLLGLCIPLTPPNVIMYLKVLFCEGDFCPLNKVEIVSRYISEVLRGAGDAYSETFNSKNKTDILCCLAYDMYKDKRSYFDNYYWQRFTREYKLKTLNEFDSDKFLYELIESRLIVQSGPSLFFKYSFFYIYFLGKYISARHQNLIEFMENGEYMAVGDVIEVITGINSNNTQVINVLNSRLESDLARFEEKYIRRDFDPLRAAIWADASTEEEQLWAPIAAEIASGPRSPREIDLIKTSLIAEQRTADQEVRFHEFVELETSLFYVSKLLRDALRNSDEIDGSHKLRALDNCYRVEMVALQIGAIFSEILAKSPVFRWGGVVFLDFNRASDAEDKSIDHRIAIIESLGIAVSKKQAKNLGPTNYRLFLRQDIRLETQDFFS